jgi:hypothetical protein
LDARRGCHARRAFKPRRLFFYSKHAAH